MMKQYTKGATAALPDNRFLFVVSYDHLVVEAYVLLRFREIPPRLDRVLLTT